MLLRSIAFSGFALVALGAACGDDTETTTSAAGGTTAGTGASSSSTSAASTTTTGAAGGAGGAGSGGAGGSGGTGGSSGTLVAGLDSMQFFVNCQPIVSEDPVLGSFIATYDNTSAAAASAEVASATLVFTQGNEELVWSFDVLPTGSGTVAAGQSTTAAHEKQTVTGTVNGQPCGFCDGTWSLEVTWQVGSTTVSETLDGGPVECAF